MKKFVLFNLGVLFSLTSIGQVCDGLALGGDDKTICKGDSVLIGAQFQTGNTQYRWEPTVNVSSPDEFQTYVSPEKTTNYLFIVTDTDFGCTDTDTVVVTVVDIELDLGPDTVICGGAFSMTLDASTAIKGTTYLWSTGETSSSIKVTSGGTYWAEVSKDGCTLRDSINISNSALLVSIIGIPGFSCNGSSIPLTAQSAPGDYLWSTGETTQTIQALLPGTYWVQVTVGNCVGSDTTTINGINPPQVDLGKDTTICLGDSLQLGFSGQTGNTFYQWQPAEFFNDPNRFQTKVGPTKTIEIIFSVTDTRVGCTGRDTMKLWVLDTEDLGLTDDTLLCVGKDTSAVLEVKDIPFTTYSWSTSETTREITVNTPGDYMVTASNGKCTATDTAFIDAATGCIESVEEYIHNMITIHPNPVRNGFYSNAEVTEVFNVSGKVLLTTRDRFVDVAHLANGMYLVRLLENGQYKFGRIIKE